MAKVLVVEDDLGVSNAVKDYLQAQLHIVEAVFNGADAEAFLQTYEYDAIVLDLTLPDVDGLEVLKRYRAKGGHARVLILSGRNQISDKERGLDDGADDYLTKPFHATELAARLRALLRRPAQTNSNNLKVGALELDLQTYKLSRAGLEIALQPKEFALLEFFMRHPDQVFSADALLDQVWSADSETSPETLRVHIKRLRDKITQEGKPSPIQTLKGIGYKLEQSCCV